MDVSIRPLRGEDIKPWLTAIAELRIAVFREFPYCYDGDLDYEKAYLGRYIACPESLVVLALSGDGVAVGASTALPLTAADAAFQQPFLQAGLAVEDYFYCGESVLRPDWRGQGLGHRFFDERESLARELGLSKTAFCAVLRPEDHPARPKHYRPLHEFWQHRGYRRQPQLRCQFPWRDIGEAEESLKTLEFWIRDA